MGEKMRLILSILSIVFFFLMVSSSAAQQAGEPTRLRVMQLSFMSEEPFSAFINIWFDDDLVFENVVFPFTTDYVELSPGTHTITTAVAMEEPPVAAVTLNLEAGQSYTVIVDGDYSVGSVDFTLIPENDLPLDETGSAAILVNQLREPIDAYIDDELIVEGLNPNDYALRSLPNRVLLITVTRAGDPDTIIYEVGGEALPNTTLLAVVIGSNAEDATLLLQRTSDLPITDYLKAHLSDGAFRAAAELLLETDVLAGLESDTDYTLFLPSNASGVAELSDQDLAEMLSNHITEGSLPPYALIGTETLTMTGSLEATLVYGETESGYWEIEGAPILWDVQVANGIIYYIDGVIQ